VEACNLILCLLPLGDQISACYVTSPSQGLSCTSLDWPKYSFSQSPHGIEYTAWVLWFGLTGSLGHIFAKPIILTYNFNTYDTLYCILCGVARPTIQFRYANIAMFINYQHYQFLNKLIMIMSWNLHSRTTSSGTTVYMFVLVLTISTCQANWKLQESIFSEKQTRSSLISGITCT
jgi:hypothetical protein